MIDHLKQVRTASDSSVLSNRMSSDTVVTVVGVQSKFDPVYDIINTMHASCNRIEKLQGIKRTGLPSEQKKALQEMDQIVVSTSPLIQNAKKRLQQIQKEVLRENRNASAKKTHCLMLENTFNSCTRSFKEALGRYQASTHKFRDAVKIDFTRQAKIVNPEISQQQIQQMLESRDPAQYLQTQIMAISPQILDEVAELEAEHQRCHKLEKTLEEIQELFNALAGLVVKSGQKLDEIEVNVQSTRDAAESGRKQLSRAEEYAVQTRKTKLKTYAVLIVCLVIGIIVLLIALKPYLCALFGC